MLHLGARTLPWSDPIQEAGAVATMKNEGPFVLEYRHHRCCMLYRRHIAALRGAEREAGQGNVPELADVGPA